MADRVVASTDTLNYFRHEFNGTAIDVGDIADILSASSYIASATDVVEAIVLLNPELPEITTDAFVFPVGTMVWEGATDDAYETTLSFTDPTADRTYTLPDGDGAVMLIGNSDAATITNKTIDFGGTGNSITGSLAEFNAALQGDSFATLTGTNTLTNKTFTSPTTTSPVLNTGISGSAVLDEDNMASDSATKVATQQSIKAYVDTTLDLNVDISADSGYNIEVDIDVETLTLAGGTGIASVTGTNSITLSIDSTVATLTGTQTFTNKTFTSPLITAHTFSSGTSTSGLNIGANGIIFEGATADAYETTLTVADPTADHTITIPNSTMTAITTATHATQTNHIARCMALG
jgi:hypothetical protein